MKKTLWLVLICLLCLGMAWPALAQGGEGIVFSDAVLEQKVREAMGKPEGPITAEDAAALTWLDAEALQDAPEDAKIKSLEGLEDFYNLEGLHLSFNAIHDITILAKLPHLRGLWLDGNPIDDLSPLGELTGLDNLSFDGGFRELPFLKNLTELVELNIGACRELPQELLGMKKLTVFKAPGGELADISLLVQLYGLSAVDVSWNLVEDLEPLRNLPLTELYIAGDPIEDYTPIREIIPNLVGMDFDTAVVLAADIPQDPLTFPDANLEQALRAVMGIQDRPLPNSIRCLAR
jgi:internalin A